MVSGHEVRSWPPVPGWPTSAARRRARPRDSDLWCSPRALGSRTWRATPPTSASSPRSGSRSTSTTNSGPGAPAGWPTRPGTASTGTWPTWKEIRRTIGADRMVVIGHSCGGALSAHYLAAHPGPVRAGYLAGSQFSLTAAFVGLSLVQPAGNLRHCCTGELGAQSVVASCPVTVAQRESRIQPIGPAARFGSPTASAGPVSMPPG